MKHLRHLHLLVVLVATLLLGASPAARAYPVTFPTGFSLFVNHHAPISIQNIPLSGIAEAQILLQNHIDPLQATVTENYIADGTQWLLPDGTGPATRIFGTGEGFWFFNPDLPITLNIATANSSVSRLSDPGDFPPGFTVPGWHLRGRQGIGAGTFESTFGRSPRDYAFVQVVRWDPVANTYQPIAQFSGVGKNAKWSPEAPILDAGPTEAAYFKLGPFYTSGAQASHGNLHYFAPSAAGFTFTGITPGAATLGPVTLRLTGSGFNGTEQVQLARMSGGTLTPWKPVTLVDPEGYIVEALFTAGDLAALSVGNCKVNVKRSSGPIRVLNYAFRKNGASPALRLTLTGPTLAKNGTLTPGYNLKITGNFAGQVSVSMIIPPGLTLDSGSPALILAGVSGTAAGFDVNLPSFSGVADYAFNLTPSLSSLPTVDLVAKILLPLSEKTGIRLPVKVVNSLDPNEKSGPVGIGSGQYITGLDPSDYVVRFENTPSATAPAQRVEIVDQLDSTRFDLSTFELTAVGFGPKVVAPPPGLQHWTTDVPYDVDGDASTLDDNIVVRIEAGLDTDITSSSFGQAKWTFQSLESAPPNLPVSLPMVGFLPANVSPPSGEGRVGFRITPRSNIGTGGTIANQASIVFDQNPPILTGTWSNTIDLDPPESSVNVLAATQTTTAFAVQWSATDADSGVASYDVYVSDNGAPYTPWQLETTATSATFIGEDHHTYRFYSVAVDQVGNREDDAESADAETKIELASTFVFVLRPGYNAFSNPLNHGGNTLDEIFSGLPAETQVLKWDCRTAAFETAIYDGFMWMDPAGGSLAGMTLEPGVGVFIVNPEPQSLELTLTGTPQLPGQPLAETCGCGRTNLLGPRSAGFGTFQDVTGEAPRTGSVVERFLSLTQSHAVSVFDGETWNPAEPVLELGEAAYFFSPCPEICLTLLCASNRVVECGSDWGFTPPTVQSACCSLPATIAVVSTVTNGVCPQFITRTWLATNGCGQFATCSQIVTVVDTAPPTITCPTNIIVLSATNVVVEYAPIAADTCDPDVRVSCVPPSGTAFAPGTTNLIQCVAIDACGHSNTCTFTVAIVVPRGDLFIGDTPVGYAGTPDSGDEPVDGNMVGQPMWVSREIWVHQDCLQLAGTSLTHQNPRYGQQNCVFAHVKNRGTAPISGAKVQLWFANASLGLTWPAQWNLIGTYSLPTLNPGDDHLAQASWFPPGTGHYCLVARIVSNDDPMAVAEGANIAANVRANNNIAWRNVNVAECLTTPGRKVEVRVRNFEPASKRLTLIFTVDSDFLPGGGEAILHPGSPLFARWQEAGGRGVNIVITNGHEIRFTGTPARVEGIPFGEEEERIFNLTLRADKPMPVPGTSHTYHASLQQELDGDVVGGVDYVLVTRALDTDTDDDGIPDVTDADDDGDGVDDAEDPSPAGESDCPLTALVVQRDGERVTLTWSGLGYRLQATTDFTRWEDLDEVTSPATLPANGPHRFFRLICQ